MPSSAAGSRPTPSTDCRAAFACLGTLLAQRGFGRQDLDVSAHHGAVVTVRLFEEPSAGEGTVQEVISVGSYAGGARTHLTPSYESGVHRCPLVSAGVVLPCSSEVISDRMRTPAYTNGFSARTWLAGVCVGVPTPRSHRHPGERGVATQPLGSTHCSPLWRSRPSVTSCSAGRRGRGSPVLSHTCPRSQGE
jgi:hypothetical protein